MNTKYRGVFLKEEWASKNILCNTLGGSTGFEKTSMYSPTLNRLWHPKPIQSQSHVFLSYTWSCLRHISHTVLQQLPTKIRHATNQDNVLYDRIKKSISTHFHTLFFAQMTQYNIFIPLHITYCRFHWCGTYLPIKIRNIRFWLCRIAFLRIYNQEDQHSCVRPELKGSSPYVSIIISTYLVCYIFLKNNKYHIRAANWLTVYNVEPVIIFENTWSFLPE